jgi:hexosaminidase
MLLLTLRQSLLKVACSYLTILLLMSSAYQARSQNVNTAVIPLLEKKEVTGEWSDIKRLNLHANDQWHQRFYQALKQYPYHKLHLIYNDVTNLEVSLNEELPTNTLAITAKGIKCEVQDTAGFYTLMSMLCQLSVLNDGRLPIGEFQQQARFGYRGMHLDVARHMYPKESILKYIDFLFFYGFNKFHWHLTEDQGWRIEIKKYPKLQTIAAYREETLIGHYSDQPHQFDGQRYGGYYTQEEVKEVVEYAHSRGIEVIPEIELPGHSLAAITAYPELSCDPEKDYAVATKWGVFEDIYCPTEKTFTFLQDVLDEVLALFPSHYIHIGGDEAPKQAWKDSEFCQALIKAEGLKDEYELQSYFIRRIEHYLNDKGRDIIGWDEILEGGLAPNATVMSWRGLTGGIEAANEHHKVIMTPTSHCYFDYYQSTHADEPLAIGGFLPLEKVYNFDPIPEDLPKDKHQYIWGAQGNVWTEYMKDFAQVEYMALARMAALSEVLYVDKSMRNYPQFAARLNMHVRFWKDKKVNIADHLLDIDPKVERIESGKAGIADFGLGIPVTVQYQPQGEKEWQDITSKPFLFTRSGKYHFRAIDSDAKTGRSATINFQNHKGLYAEIALKHPPHAKYYGNGPYSIINGVFGSDEKYGDLEWLGFDGKDLDAELSFEKPARVKGLKMRFYNGEGQWIYLPKKVEVHITAKGKAYTFEHNLENVDRQQKVITIDIPIPELDVDQMQIKAVNFGVIPDGKQGAGHEAWLFVDEILFY